MKYYIEVTNSINIVKRKITYRMSFVMLKVIMHGTKSTKFDCKFNSGYLCQNGKKFLCLAALPVIFSRINLLFT